MSVQVRTKLNVLFSTWPKGTVAVQPWLDKQGAYRQLLRSYQRTDWVRSFARGVFVRSDDQVDWTGGLYALQTQLGLKIYAGGKIALNIMGYAHFLSLGVGPAVTLFGPPGERLPKWFKQHNWGPRIRYTATNLFSEGSDLALTQKNFGDYAITLSAPERAMMEVLHAVPLNETFDESKLLMEGMATLRPNLVQTLLECCNSVKVKRLFLFLAEGCGHAWVKRIDTSKLDLGKGNRVIVKGGRLDQKYLITVPKNPPTPTETEGAV